MQAMPRSQRDHFPAPGLARLAGASGSGQPSPALARRWPTSALATAGGLSLVFYGVVALTHYAALRALGLRVSLADLAAVAPLVILVTALPVAPNGLGIGEGVFVLLYTQIDVAPEAALAAAVLRRAIVMLVALAGGIVWLLPAREDIGLPDNSG
jgi:uncharacterized protein (TIRG00374 family)